MKTVIISQARMGSTRLPGKILKVAAGKPLLLHHLERLRRCREADEVVVATSDGPADDVVEAFCHEHGYVVVRGSEADVLARFEKAARLHGADIIVRVTSDCPLIDPAVVDEIIRRFKGAKPPVDYASNIDDPRSFPRGLDAEVFSRAALERSHRAATDPREREHLTRHIRQRPEDFTKAEVRSPVDFSVHRWTVDTAEDFELVSRLLEALLPGKPQFTMVDVLSVLQAHPEWVALNAHVEQKKI